MENETSMTEIDKIVEELRQKHDGEWGLAGCETCYEEGQQELTVDTISRFLREKLTTYTTSVLENIEGELPKEKPQLEHNEDNYEANFARYGFNDAVQKIKTIIRSYKKP